MPDALSPSYITHNGEIKLVIEDPANYQRTKDTLAMLKLLNLRERERQAGAYEYLDTAIDDVLNGD